jgi:hypothetical protein
MTRSEGIQEPERESLPLSARLVGHWSLVSFEASATGTLSIRSARTRMRARPRSCRY